MSLCKYFLNGNCRYGDNCRYSHATDTRPSHHQQHQYRPQSHYRPQQQQQQQHYHYQQQQFRHPRPQNDQRFSFVAAANSNNNNNNKNQSRQSQVFHEAIQWARTNFTDSEYALDILQQLQTEARVWLKSSSLWRFTAKSICPGGQPIPDWQDFSFEEVRWEYYVKKAHNQEHLYRKACTDYWEATERQLVGLSRLRVETLNIFKPYIEQCMHMRYHPKKALETDVDMKNSTGVQNQYPTATMTMASGSTPFSHHEQASTNYTPDDVLLDDERAAFNSDSFEFGNVPLQAPSMKFS